MGSRARNPRVPEQCALLPCAQRSAPPQRRHDGGCARPPHIASLTAPSAQACPSSSVSTISCSMQPDLCSPVSSCAVLHLRAARRLHRLLLHSCSRRRTTSPRCRRRCASGPSEGSSSTLRGARPRGTPYGAPCPPLLCAVHPITAPSQEGRQRAAPASVPVERGPHCVPRDPLRAR